MTEFINFEVGVEEDNNEEEENEVSDDSDLDSLSSFIDNEQAENDVNFYRNFEQTDIEQTLKADYDRGLEDIENFDGIQIYVKVRRMMHKLMNLKLQQKR